MIANKDKAFDVVLQNNLLQSVGQKSHQATTTTTTTTTTTKTKTTKTTKTTTKKKKTKRRTKNLSIVWLFVISIKAYCCLVPALASYQDMHILTGPLAQRATVAQMGTLNLLTNEPPATDLHPPSGHSNHAPPDTLGGPLPFHVMLLHGNNNSKLIASKQSKAMEKTSEQETPRPSDGATPQAPVSSLAELNPDASDSVPAYMQHMTTVLVILHVSVFVTGLVGNSLVCLSVYRNKSLQTVTNYYIVNLALADFLVILICLPPTVYWDLNLTWNFGLILCKLVLYLQSISVSVSVLTLTCISIDRWYAICHPLEFSSTKSRAKVIIALIWLASMLIASPDVIFLVTKPLYEEEGYTYMDCTYSWPEENTKIYQLCIVTLLFVLPFVLMSISYLQIVNVLWRNETMEHSFLQSAEALEAEQLHIETSRLKYESRIAAAAAAASLQGSSASTPNGGCGEKRLETPTIDGAGSGRFSDEKTTRKPDEEAQVAGVAQVPLLSSPGGPLSSSQASEPKRPMATKERIYILLDEQKQQNRKRQDESGCASELASASTPAHNCCFARVQPQPAPSGPSSATATCGAKTMRHSRRPQARSPVEAKRRQGANNVAPTRRQVKSCLGPDKNECTRRSRKQHVVTLGNLLEGHDKEAGPQLLGANFEELANHQAKAATNKTVAASVNDGERQTTTTGTRLRPHVDATKAVAPDNDENKRKSGTPDIDAHELPRDVSIQTTATMGVSEEDDDRKCPSCCRSATNRQSAGRRSLRGPSARSLGPVGECGCALGCARGKQRQRANGTATIAGLPAASCSHCCSKCASANKRAGSVRATKHPGCYFDAILAQHSKDQQSRSAGASVELSLESGATVCHHCNQQHPEGRSKRSPFGESNSLGQQTKRETAAEALPLLQETQKPPPPPDNNLIFPSNSTAEVTAVVRPTDTKPANQFNSQAFDEQVTVQQQQQQRLQPSEGLSEALETKSPFSQVLERSIREKGSQCCQWCEKQRRLLHCQLSSCNQASKSKVASSSFVGSSAAGELERSKPNRSLKAEHALCCPTRTIEAGCAQMVAQPLLELDEREMTPTSDDDDNQVPIKAKQTKANADSHYEAARALAKGLNGNGIKWNGRRRQQRPTPQQQQQKQGVYFAQSGAANYEHVAQTSGQTFPARLLAASWASVHKRTDRWANDFQQAASAKGLTGRAGKWKQEEQNDDVEQSSKVAVSRCLLEPNGANSINQQQDHKQRRARLATTSSLATDISTTNATETLAAFPRMVSNAQDVGTNQANHQQASSSASVSISNARFYKLIESRKKAAKMLIIVVIMFGLCYLPIHFLNTLRYTIGLPQNDLTTIASLVSHWLCYFNSAVNPLIYNLMSGKFRHEFANLFFCRWIRRSGPSNGISAINKPNGNNNNAMHT